MRNANSSGILERQEKTVCGFRMTVEPGPTPYREEVPPDQEVVRLFDEMYAPLRRYVTFLGLLPEDAEDAVQEAFLRLYKHLGSRRDRTNLRGWLFRVARNLARDKRRGAWMQRTRIFGQPDDGLSSVEDPKDTPENKLLKEERLAWLRSALGRLTPQQAECLQLRVAGLRYREIAEVMGIGISAVGELVQRATNRLNEDSHGY